MEAVAIYSQQEGALSLDQTDSVLAMIRDRKAVLIESSGGPEGWHAGYAVPVEGVWYWFPCDTALYRRLPAFVRSEEDAHEFIRVMGAWYEAGVNGGVEYAQSRLRNWVNKKMLNEL